MNILYQNHGNKNARQTSAHAQTVQKSRHSVGQYQHNTQGQVGQRFCKQGAQRIWEQIWNKKYEI